MYKDLPTPLSREEEQRLFAVYKSTPIYPPEWLAAREQLMVCNIRLIVKMVRKYTQDRPLARRYEDDLIATLIAHMPVDMDAFDPSRGFKFCTYLATSVYRRMPQIVRTDAFAVRLPPNLKQDRGPLSRECHERDRWSNGDAVDDAIDGERSELLDACLDMLTDRERQVVGMRMGFDGASPLTLADVGRAMGVTKQRTEQIQKRAYRKLLNAARERGLTAAAVA